MRHVIGFGNQLHGDDGFGPAVCARLQALALAADVRVFDAGTRGIDALALLCACSEAILLDAGAPDGNPGRVTHPDPAALREQLPDPPGTAWHAAGLGYLLRAMAAIDAAPPRIRIVSAEAATVAAFAPTLSAPMALAVDAVTALLAAELGAACEAESG